LEFELFSSFDIGGAFVIPPDGSSMTSTDILTALRTLGISPGDLLIVHSSLKSLGHVDGGAGAVAHALLETASPGGTVFVPTFTYAKLPYDPATTPSLAGAISEAVRTMPRARRSLQPTHPWAAVGPAAEEILAGHGEQTTPFGPGSPVWRLWELDAKVLLLGVDHRANSMIHVAEESLDLPYLRRTRVAQVVRAGGRVEEIVVRRPGHSGGFNRVQDVLVARRDVTEGRVGDAKALLMRARPLVAAAQEILGRDPAGLLCDDPACAVCGEARAMLRKTEPPRR
jgi:aminoglycoside 3-N-acetyltransferase